MITGDLRDYLEGTLFSVKGFEGLWYNIKAMYEQLGFTDPLADGDRIKEYTYISQQFRKYVGTKKGELLVCKGVEEMIEKIQGWLDAPEVYKTSRKETVYQFLCDHWLIESIGYLEELLVDDGEEGSDE